MRIEGHHRTWDARDEAALEEVLRFRDRVGGAQLWMAGDDEPFPVLAIRVSGAVADVHYFPFQGHPGFRALAPDVDSSAHGGEPVTFVYEGCDPSSGEDQPGEFVLPVETALGLAREFYRDRKLPSDASWFEL